jgi:Flp pilus assembly pilin Flp
MSTLVRDNPLIALTVAFFRTRIDARLDTARERGERGERGASAVEWVVIAAICVVAALAIGAAVMAVVNANKAKIQQGTNLPS